MDHQIQRHQNLKKKIKIINDLKVYLKFEADELELLQDNSWQMAESFGLDVCIDNLKGKRKVGFYSWDLESLECVISEFNDTPVGEKLYKKIKNGIDFIHNERKSRSK